MAAPRIIEGSEKLRLKVVAGNAVGTMIEVGQELMIGRLAEGEGTLAADIEISRQHARIKCEPDGRYAIEDLGSTNGTYLNGRRLDGPATLETGDRIEVGASALVVQVSAPQPTPPSYGTIPALPRDEEPPAEPEPEAEEAAGVPTAAASEPAPAARTELPAFVLRIEMDPAAGKATVSLDESSDEVSLVYEDGRWRFA